MLRKKMEGLALDFDTSSRCHLGTYSERWRTTWWHFWYHTRLWCRRIVRSEHMYVRFSFLVSRKSPSCRDFVQFCLVLLRLAWGSILFEDRFRTDLLAQGLTATPPDILLLLFLAEKWAETRITGDLISVWFFGEFCADRFWNSRRTRTSWIRTQDVLICFFEKRFPSGAFFALKLTDRNGSLPIRHPELLSDMLFGHNFVLTTESSKHR